MATPKLTRKRPVAPIDALPLTPIAPYKPRKLHPAYSQSEVDSINAIGQRASRLDKSRAEWSRTVKRKLT